LPTTATAPAAVAARQPNDVAVAQDQVAQVVAAIRPRCLRPDDARVLGEILPQDLPKASPGVREPAAAVG
jgi:hypothetical protein